MPQSFTSYIQKKEVVKMFYFWFITRRMSWMECWYATHWNKILFPQIKFRRKLKFLGLSVFNNILVYFFSIFQSYFFFLVSLGILLYHEGSLVVMLQLFATLKLLTPDVTWLSQAPFKFEVWSFSKLAWLLCYDIWHALPINFHDSGIYSDKGRLSHEISRSFCPRSGYKHQSHLRFPEVVTKLTNKMLQCKPF